MIRAVIFDFDGTILDTEVPDYEAWQEIYRRHECDLTLDAWSKCLGTGYDLFNPYDHLEELSGVSIDRDEITREHRQRFLAHVERQPISPGVREYIEAAKELGLKLAVASSAERGWVLGHLTRHGLLDRFDAIRGREDVERVKPDPALYLSALEALEVEAHEAIAIEDSPNGARAAKAAGIYCVVVPNAVSCSLDLDHADRRLTSLAEIRLHELIEGCGGARR